jgi:serine protease AprX
MHIGGKFRKRKEKFPLRKSLKILFALLMVLSLALPLNHSGTAVAQTQSAVIGKSLQDKLASGINSFEVIVTFHGQSSPNLEQLALLKGTGVKNALTLKSLPMAGVVATSSQIQELAKSDQVRSIFLNEELTYYNADAKALTGVDKVRTDSSMTKENGGLPFTGKGIGVVVNDSGVDGTHKDHELGKNLVQNVMASANLHSISGLFPISYQENVPNTDTNSGHGTHVAGTVGGIGAMSGGKYEGAAPGADLIGYGSGAALFVLDGIGGFDYAISHQAKYNIRVITNSWGSSGDFEPEHPINIASKAAYDRGITVLFAAGNSGPGENTHNPYSKAPWVISVAAGEKSGKLADFSSRGTKDTGGTFEMDGKTWTWKDEPSVTAPGVDIVSTRVIAPVSSLGVTDDVEGIDPAHVPYYTTMSGTSMATPHVAGITALLLEADPSLSPQEIKDILQQTATNMPGMESWEVGAGYVNAYAAMDRAVHDGQYGETVNAYTTFNSNVEMAASKEKFSLTYDPVNLTSTNQHNFTVNENNTTLVGQIHANGIDEETGNPINLVLIDPSGNEYSSGVSLLFPLETDRTVVVDAPKPGEWKLEIRGLRGAEENPTGGAGLPEEVDGTITFKTAGGYTGLSDINGHAAASAIQTAVSERLVDGYADGSYKPNQLLTRSELAKYLVMGAEIRQSIDSKTNDFTDVKSSEAPFINAATARGGAFRDAKQISKGVILPKSAAEFAPDGTVDRTELAYSLVQSLGLEKQAGEMNTETLSVQYGDTRIPLDDASNIPQELRGYVQLALDLNILNAYFTVEQGPYDLEPAVHASFKPAKTVTRGDYAVAAVRYYHAFLK